MIAITIYSLQLVVGLVANLYSLVHLLRERFKLHNKNRMILLLIHLTCADLIVCALKSSHIFPHDAVMWISLIRLDI